MKIYYIVNARIPTEKAHGYQIVKMFEAFVESGVDVELVVPNRPNPIKEESHDFYGLEERIKTSYISVPNIISTKYFSEKTRYVVYRLLYILRLSQIKISKRAVIYTREPEISWLFSLKGFKTIYEAHTWPSKKIGLLKYLLKKVDLVVVISNGLKNEFIKNNFSNIKIVVAPDAVDRREFSTDISQYEARRKLNLNLDKKIVVYTGHLYAWKGAEVLASSTQYLNNSIAIHFVGGTENDVKKFRAKFCDLIKSQKILVHGHKSRKQIPLWLKAADVLALPNSSKFSISKNYTSPLKMFEYMASGRPIVASRLPSIMEVLNNNNAYFFSPDDPKSIAHTINQALKSTNEARQKASQSLEDVKKYTWQNRAKKIIGKII